MNIIKVDLQKEDFNKLSSEYVLNLFTEKTKYSNDVLEVVIENKSILKAQRKYTYKSKNQIKTDYLHISLFNGTQIRQTKTGWISK